jgi:L-seryl-tRNA(Ser) seleniumtransferase
MNSDPRRALPSVDALAAHPLLAGREAARAVVVEAARQTLSEARDRVAAGAPAPAADDLASDALRRVEALLAPPLRPLINATGVILHTNLGRAPLPGEAVDAMAAASRGYSNLEFDLETGRRGSRHTILEPLLCRLTGAEAAMAVNNNAAAVLLALSALAAGKQVVISRGQLVEIGGGFRIPDVMRQSRAKLVECGTTNRTRAADYDAAITPATAAIMRVHASNFRIVGFAAQPSLDELAAVARARGVLLIDDIGSGCLLDTSRYGLAPEPVPQHSIAAGADVVLFSGDKLLGGPQGGLIAGSHDALAKMKRHPLARALRLDKASIAGLAATLRLYVEGRAEERIPVWRMIAAPLDAIAKRAGAIAAALGGSVIDSRSMVGGGSLPEESLPSRAVVLPPQRTAAALAAALRRNAVVARIDDGRLLLDLRTVFPEQDAALIDACRAALASP